MRSVHHAFDYIEINVSDMAASRAFYERAFGWEFLDYGPDYSGIKGPDGDVGGLNGEREPGPGGPLVLLYSDDLDATVESVVAAGGVVVEQPYDFPGGRRFIFADPSGNRLGVWTKADEPAE
jgi:predicted enzyme related to lactoylglutathione lyase